MTTLSVVEGTLLKNFEAWVKAKGLPFVVAECGVLAADPNGASKMQTFYDNMTDGTRDCPRWPTSSTPLPAATPAGCSPTAATAGCLSKFKALMVALEFTMIDLGFC